MSLEALLKRRAAAGNKKPGAAIIAAVATRPQTVVRLPVTPEIDPFANEAFEERAAIREYDGGFNRKEAERLAIADLERTR